MGADIDLELISSLHESMLRIRLIEESLAELYKEQEMRTPTHFSIGQEAVAAGVCEALTREDVVYSGHRSHAHFLAKGGDLGGLVAELYGKATGVSRGRGGSVHLSARDVGFIASSAILGETIATAVGSALAFFMDGEARVAVTFFGDGTIDEGIFSESLNFAAVHKLPVIFVCENNLYSTNTTMGARQPAGTVIADRAEALSVPAQRVDGYDVVAVYEATRAAREFCLAGAGPRFLEVSTYRWREHVGPYEDHHLGYRSLEELQAWMERDPIKATETQLESAEILTPDKLDQRYSRIKEEIEKAVSDAKSSPFPDVKELLEDTY